MSVHPEPLTRYPKLLIEVLSDSTAAIDAGDKLETAPPIISGAIELSSIQVAIELIQIYEDVTWVPAVRDSGQS